MENFWEKDAIAEDASTPAVGNFWEADEPSFWEKDAEALPARPKPRDIIAKSLQDSGVYNSFTESLSGPMFGEARPLTRKKDGDWDIGLMTKTPEGFIDQSINAIQQLVGTKLGLDNDNLIVRGRELLTMGFLEGHDPKAAQNALHKAQQEGGFSDEEMAAGYEDLRKSLTKFEDDEPARVLSDGTVMPNMANSDWLDDEKAKAIIDKLPISSEAKERELASLSQKQKSILPHKLEAYTVASVGTTLESPSDWADRTGRSKEFGTKQFLLDYEREVASKSGWMQGLGAGFHKGNLKLAMTLTGAKAMVTGDEDDAQEAASYAYASSMLSEGSFDTGLIGSLQEELPSLIAIATITRGVGAGVGSAVASRIGAGGMTKALSAGVGRTIASRVAGTAAAEATGATVVQAASTAAATTAMLTTSFAQSAGATFASSIQEGDTVAEARDKATKAGLTTALVTGLFQMGGLAGLEGQMVGKNAAQVTVGQLVKSFKGGDLLGAVKNFAVQTGMAVAGEGLEEGIDEAIQAFVTADPDTNLADAWSNAWEAAKIGGFIGGVAHVGGGELNAVFGDKSADAQRLVPKQVEALDSAFSTDATPRESLGIVNEGALRAYAKMKIESLRKKQAETPDQFAESDQHTLAFLEENGEGDNFNAEKLAASVQRTLDTKATKIGTAAMAGNQMRPQLKTTAGIVGGNEAVAQDIEIPHHSPKKGTMPIKVAAPSGGYAGTVEALYGAPPEGMEYALPSGDNKQASFSYAPHATDPNLDVILIKKGDSLNSTGRAINRDTGEVSIVGANATKQKIPVLNLGVYTSRAKVKADEVDPSAREALRITAETARSTKTVVESDNLKDVFDQASITRAADNKTYEVGGEPLQSQTTAQGKHKSLEFDAPAVALTKAGGDPAKQKEILAKWEADAAAGDVVHAGVSKALNTNETSGNPKHDQIAMFIKERAKKDGGATINSEVKVADDSVAGTIDIAYKKANGKWTIIDIKSTDLDLSTDAGLAAYKAQKALGHQVQTHGYASILAESGIEVDETLVLPVARDGSMFTAKDGGQLTIDATPSKQAVKILSEIRGSAKQAKSKATDAKAPEPAKEEAAPDKEPSPEAPKQEFAKPVEMDAPLESSKPEQKDEVETEPKTEAKDEREMPPAEDVDPDMMGLDDISFDEDEASGPKATATSAQFKEQKDKVVMPEGEKNAWMKPRTTKSGEGAVGFSGTGAKTDINTELETGSVVIGTDKGGRMTSAHVVTMKEALPDGGFKYHLAPVASKSQTIGSRGFKTKEVLGRLFGAISYYMPKSSVIDGAVNAIESIREQLANGKPIGSPEVLSAVEQMVRDQIAEIAGPTFSEENVVVSSDTDLMHVEVVDGAIKIFINPANIAADLYARTGHANLNNEIARKSAVIDYAELTSLRAFEEILHYYVMSEMSDAEVGKLALDSMKAARSNPALAASLRSSMEWRIRGALTAAERAGKTDSEIDALVLTKLDRMMPLDADGNLGNAKFRTDEKTEIMGMGHEWIASLISRIVTGKDPASAMADMGLTLANAKEADKNIMQSLIDRVVELSNRLIEAVKRLLGAQRLINGGNVPEGVRQAIERVMTLMDEGGVKGPDVMGVQEAAISQQVTTLRGAAKHLSIGMEVVESQDKLREQLDAIRRARGDASFTPVTIENGRLVPVGLTEEEEGAIAPLLDSINEGSRPLVVAHLKQAEEDLSNILSLRYLGDPLFEKRFKEIKKTGRDGSPITATIESIVVNEQPLYRSIRQAIEAESGMTLDGLLDSINAGVDRSSSSVVDAIRSRDEVKREIERFVASTDSNFADLISRRDALLSVIAKISSPDASPPTVPIIASETTIEQSEAWSKYQDKLQKLRNKADSVIARIEAATRSFESRNREGDSASPLAAPYYTLKGRLDSAQADLRNAQEQLHDPVSNLQGLLGRYLADPVRTSRLIGESLVSPTMSDADKVEAQKRVDRLTGALRIASESGMAAKRLLDFRNELSYFMLGGKTPRSIWSPSRGWSRLDIAMPEEVKLMPVHVGPMAFHSGPIQSLDRVNPLVPTATFSSISEFGEMRIRSGEGAYDKLVERRPDGSLELTTNDRAMVMNALSKDIARGYADSFKLLGVSQEWKNRQAFDEFGELLGNGERLSIMKGNAIAISGRLGDIMFDEFWRGNTAISDVALDSGGFPLRLETIGSRSVPVMDDNLPYEADGSVLAGTDGNVDDMVGSGFFASVVNGASNFLARSQSDSVDYTRPLLSHDNGLTPLGLAHSIVAPRLLRLLALTKGQDVVIQRGSLQNPDLNTIRLDDGDASEAYGRLAFGLENAEEIVRERKRMMRQDGLGIKGASLKDAVWDLHNAMQIANTIYRSALRRAESREKNITKYNQDAAYPLNQKAMMDVEFGRFIHRNRSSSALDHGDHTLYTLMRADAPMDLINQYNSITYQRAILTKRGINPDADFEVARTQDIVGSSAETYYAMNAADRDTAGRISEDDMTEERLKSEEDRERRDALDLSAWRARALSAILGGNKERVRMFVADPRWTSGDGEFNTEQMDSWIVDKLYDLHQEHKDRGLLVEFGKSQRTGRSFDKAFEDSAKPFQEHSAMVGAILESGGHVQMSQLTGSPAIDPKRFQAGQDGPGQLVYAISSMIKNLAVVDGKVRWELSQDVVDGKKRIPTIAFIQSADAPSIVFPYGSKVEVTLEDAKVAMESMFEWLHKYGNVNTIQQANRIVRAIQEAKTNPLSLKRSIMERMKAELRVAGPERTPEELAAAELEIDAKEQEISDISSFYTSGVNGAVIKSLDELADRATAPFFDPYAKRRVTTPNQAAKILTTLLTDRYAQQAFVFSLRSAPSVGPISPENASLWGRVINLGNMPVMSDVASKEEMRAIAKARNIIESVDTPDQSAAEDASDIVGTLDLLFMRNEAGSKFNSPIADIQTQWANELVNDVLNRVRPDWSGFVPSPFDNSSTGADAPRGLAYGLGDEKPKKLSEFEARQLLAGFSDEYIRAVANTEPSDVGWNGAGAQRLSVEDLMRVSAEEANMLRRIFDDYKPFEKGDQYQMDRDYHYKQWSFARMGGAGELWFQGRIRKGMFPEAMADGAFEMKTSEEAPAKLVMMVADDSLTDLAKRRKDEGREIQRSIQIMQGDQLMFERVDGDGNPIPGAALVPESDLIPVTATVRIGQEPSRDGSRDVWSKGEVITGLPYTQTVGWRLRSNTIRRDGESLADFNKRILSSEGGFRPAMETVGDLDYEIMMDRRKKAKVQREVNDMIRSSSQSTIRSSKITQDLESLQGIADELLSTKDRQEMEEVLRKGKITLSAGNWASAHKVVRDLFDGPSELTSEMASSIVDDYLDTQKDFFRHVTVLRNARRVPARAQRSSPSDTNVATAFERAIEEQKALLKEAKAELSRKTAEAKQNQSAMIRALNEWEKSKLPVYGGIDVPINTANRPQDPPTDAEVESSLAPYRKSVEDIENFIGSATRDQFAIEQTSDRPAIASPIYLDSVSIGTSTIAETRQLVESMERGIEALNDARLALDNASTPAEIESASADLVRAERSIVRRAGYWNKNARLFTRSLNARIPGLFDRSLGQLWTNPRVSTQEKVKAIAGFRAQAAALMTAAKSVSTTQSFSATIKKRLAENAIERLRRYDKSDGVSSLEFSEVSKDYTTELSPETASRISSILRNDALSRGAKQSMIQIELQASLFPHEQLTKNLVTTLSARLEKAKEIYDGGQDSSVDDLVFSIFREIDEMRKDGDLEDLSKHAANTIGIDLARKVLSGKLKHEEMKAQKMIRAALEERANFEHRNRQVFAPRPDEVNKLEYIGDEDSIAILKRNHAWRASRWEENYMREIDKTNILDGYAAAVDAAKTADERALAMQEYMEAYSGEPYHIVNGWVGPKSKPVPKRVGKSNSRLSLQTVSGLNKASMDFGRDMAERVQISIEADLKDRSPAPSVFENITNPKIKKDAEGMGLFNPRKAAAEHLQLQIAGLKQALDNGEIASPILSTQVRQLLDDLFASRRVGEGVYKEIGPLYRMVNAEIVGRAAAADLSDGYMPSRRWKEKTKPFSKMSMFDLFYHQDAAIRTLFSQKDAAIEQAVDIIGLLEHGPTGKTGLNAMRGQKDQFAKSLSALREQVFGSRLSRGMKTLNPFAKDETFYEASLGYMFFAIRDYILSNRAGAVSTDRAKSIRHMFDTALNGVNEALTKGIPQNVAGFSPTDLLSLGLPQLHRQSAKLKAYLTSETYQLLEQRKVLEQLVSDFDNVLNVAEFADSDATRDAFEKLSTTLPKRSLDWGKGVRDRLEMLKQSYIEQAKLEGQDTSYMEASSAMAFSWQSFGKVFSTSKAPRPIHERMGWHKASFLQPATRQATLEEINMLDVNGLSVPLQIADDLLFRMNVTPAYEAFRAIVGSSHITDDALVKREDDFGYLDKNAEALSPGSEGMLKDASNALAYLGQRILGNELASKAPKHRLMDAIQKLQMLGAIKALLSVSQLYIQTLPGVIAFSSTYEKGNAGFLKFYMDYLAHRAMDSIGSLAGRITGNQPNDSVAKKIDDFVALRGINVHIRTLNGERDFYENIGAVRPDKNYIRDVSGMVIRGSMELGARGLQKVLGGAEKTFANTMFAYSVLSQINKARLEFDPNAALMTIDELTARDADHAEVTSAILSSAERVVNDLIATGVASKKGSVFQQSDSTLKETLRMGLVVFSNHQVHLAANSAAARHMISSPDPIARAKGRRLLATNMSQNVLFRLTKYTMATKLLSMAIGAALGWDDDERDKFYAKFFGIDVSNPDERTAMAWVALTLGGTAPLGWDRRDEAFTEDKKNASLHQAILDISMEALKQTPIGNLGVAASTNYGSIVATKLMSLAVDPMVPGSPPKFDRAGYTVDDAEISDGQGWDNFAYGSSAFFLNDLAQLSLVASGLGHMIEPLIIASNADEVDPLDMGMLMFASAPFVPREFQGMLEKRFVDKTDAKIWGSQWKR